MAVYVIHLSMTITDIVRYQYDNLTLSLPILNDL
jgi:hypothetical protein